MHRDQSNLTIDLETGGSNAARDALLEIGAELEIPGSADYDHVLGRVVQREPRVLTFHRFVLPAPGLRIDPRCRTEGWNRFTTIEDWLERGAISEHQALRDLRMWINEGVAGQLDPMPWAHNVEHDASFLTAAERRTGIPMPIDYHWGCTMALSWLWRHKAGEPGSVGLAAMTQRIGHWSAEEAASKHHSADEDAAAAAALRRWLLARITVQEPARV